MTLLRRAPREVYRVYSEEEFFACVDHDERFAPTAAAGERRMHRVAGVTVLLAATGAVGGLIAITSLSPGAGARRRAGAGLLAATRSFMHSQTARAHVWRESSSADELRRHEVNVRRIGQRGGAAASARHAGSPRRVTPRPDVASEESAGIAVREQSTPIVVAAPVQPVRVTASAETMARRSSQSEFGFER
jgi:hypothetical protein